MKESSNYNRYCLGERKISGWMLGVASEVPDAAMWILFYFPALIYLYGVGNLWTGIGLFIGMLVNWYVIPYRIRRYRALSDKMLTVSGFLEERFEEKSGMLRYAASGIMLVCLSLFTVSFLASLKTLLAEEESVNGNLVIVLICIIAILYSVVGGIKGISYAEFIQGIVIVLVFALLLIFTFTKLTPKEIVLNIMKSRVPGGASVFLDVRYQNGEIIEIADVISQLSAGFLCIGMPQSVIKFMSMRDGWAINRGRRTAVVFSIVIIISSVMASALGRAVIYPTILTKGVATTGGILIRMTEAMFVDKTLGPILMFVVITGIAVFGQSIAASGMFTMGVTIYNDIIKNGILRKIKLKNDILYCRITVVVIGFVIMFTSLSINIDVSEVMIISWACLALSFGPVILMAVSWERMNEFGALAGLFAGPVFVLFWKYADIVEKGVSLSEYLGLNSILPSFLFGILVIVVVSLLTKPVNEDIRKKFEKVKNRIS